MKSFLIDAIELDVMKFLLSTYYLTINIFFIFLKMYVSLKKYYLPKLEFLFCNFKNQNRNRKKSHTCFKYHYHRDGINGNRKLRVLSCND